MEIVSIMVGLIVVALFVVLTRKSGASPGTLGLNAGNATVAKKKQRETPVAPKNPHGSTSIVPCENACEAVKMLGDKRFLDSEKHVPRVPLADCTVANCECKYAHHADRRQSDEDRRHPTALQSELYDTTGEVNRREQKRGRRKDDWS